MSSINSVIQHWPILQQLDSTVLSKIREFMVIGDGADGVVLITEPDGETFYSGELEFKDPRMRKRKHRPDSSLSSSIRPTSFNVNNIVRMAHGINHLLLLDKLGKIYDVKMIECREKGTNFQPKPLSSPHKFTSVRCGIGHSLALTDDGKVWAWGANGFGQLAIPCATFNHPELHRISEIDSHRVVSIVCGGMHSLALTDQGEVWAWGANESGQLGNGSCYPKHTPTRISTPNGPVKSIAAGRNHTLLLTETGEVYTCGSNEFGQQATPIDQTRNSSSLVKVSGLSSMIVEIGTPKNSSIAIGNDRSCYVWGAIGMSSHRVFRLPAYYSTIDSAFSFDSTSHNMPFSTEVQGYYRSPIVDRMFDNPDHCDVEFVVDDQHTIHAHRCILQTASQYFDRMFSQTWNPIDPKNPIFQVNISDYSYPVFYAYLRFLYTGLFEITTEHLIELFELASCYLESDLQKLCVSRMRSNMSVENCCLYYQLTDRYPLPEFQLELVRFIWSKLLDVIDSDAYQAMDSDLCKKITNTFRQVQ